MSSNTNTLHLKPRYVIGHPAYSGVNSHATFATRRYALRELVRRGVNPDAAQECLSAAETGLWQNILAYAASFNVVEIRCVR